MGISYYERAYDLSKTYPNPKREYSLLTNLAGAYNYLNNIEEAKKYYYLSVQLTHPKDTLKNYMNLLNWGLILVNEKNMRVPLKRSISLYYSPINAKWNQGMNVHLMRNCTRLIN